MAPRRRRSSAEGRRIAGILRRLPAAFRAQMVAALDDGGARIAQLMRGRAPKRTGALGAGITYKVYPRSLRLVAGLLGVRQGRSKLFYGRIQDLGRKGQTVTVRRRTPSRATTLAAGTSSEGTGRHLVQAYRMRVKPMTGKRFVTGEQPQLRALIRARLGRIFTRALQAMSGGNG